MDRTSAASSFMSDIETILNETRNPSRSSDYVPLSLGPVPAGLNSNDFPLSQPPATSGYRELSSNHFADGNHSVSNPHTFYGRDGRPIDAAYLAPGLQPVEHDSKDDLVAQLHVHYQLKLEEQRHQFSNQFFSAMNMGKAKYGETLKEIQRLSIANAGLRIDVQKARFETTQLMEDRARRTELEKTLRDEVTVLLQTKHKNQQDMKKVMEQNKRLKAESRRLVQEVQERDHMIERLEAESGVARSLAQKLHWEKKRSEKLLEANQKSLIDDGEQDLPPNSVFGQAPIDQEDSFVFGEQTEYPKPGG